MSDYVRMVSAATVGLGAKPLPGTGFDAPVDAVADAVCDPADPIGSALRVAGLYAVARRAGRLPVTLPQPVPAAPPETRPLVTGACGFLLERAVTSGPVLDVVIDEIAAAGLRVPTRLVPQLLAIRQPDHLSEQLWEVIGTGGRWFAANRYDSARPAAPADDPGWPEESAFSHGTGARRSDWVRAARRLDPARARDVVARGWAKETAESRAALIGALADPPDAGDEPFLEAALDDSTAVVRRAAVEALAGLAGSRFAERMRRRAAAVFTVRKSLLGAKIAVNDLPPDDTAATRDGLAGDGSVATVVAATAIDFWRDFFTGAHRLSAEKVAGGIADVAIVTALARSAVRGDDPAWAVPLLRRCLPRDVVGQHPTATADPRISAALLGAAATLTDAATLTGLVAELPRPFHPAVAEALFAALDRDTWGTLSQQRTAAGCLAAGFPLSWQPRCVELMDRTTDQQRHRFCAGVVELLTLRSDIAKELP